mgnify:FL=1
MADAQGNSISSSPRQLSTHHLVYCLWADAHMSMDEYTPSEVERDFHKPEMVKTFGLLVQDNAIGITLAMEEGLEDGKFRHLMFIPREMVREVVDLGIPRVKRTRAKKAPEGGEAHG